MPHNGTVFMTAPAYAVCYSVNTSFCNLLKAYIVDSPRYEMYQKAVSSLHVHMTVLYRRPLYYEHSKYPISLTLPATYTSVQ